MASPTACLVGGGERGRDHMTGAAGMCERNRDAKYGTAQGTGREAVGGLYIYS